jgi:prepilin-type N-terminal cleavage/methylation domain-containing protein
MRKNGFTLIELLVVIAIIGLLASIVLVSLNTARAKARDAKRLSDMHQIQIALAMYYDDKNAYPVSDGQGCGGWDTPGDGDFINALTAGGYLSVDFKDPNSNYDCGNYRYYRYSAGSYGCSSSRGNYFVLGIVNMETSGNPYPGSPGWNCPNRNWQSEMEWVTGNFER